MDEPTPYANERLKCTRRHPPEEILQAAEALTQTGECPCEVLHRAARLALHGGEPWAALDVALVGQRAFAALGDAHDGDALEAVRLDPESLFAPRVLNVVHQLLYLSRFGVGTMITLPDGTRVLAPRPHRASASRDRLNLTRFGANPGHVWREVLASFADPAPPPAIDAEDVPLAAPLPPPPPPSESASRLHERTAALEALLGAAQKSLSQIGAALAKGPRSPADKERRAAILDTAIRTLFAEYLAKGVGRVAAYERLSELFECSERTISSRLAKVDSDSASQTLTQQGAHGLPSEKKERHAKDHRPQRPPPPEARRPPPQLPHERPAADQRRKREPVAPLDRTRRGPRRQARPHDPRPEK